jgi:hypothetical protein
MAMALAIQALFWLNVFHCGSERAEVIKQKYVPLYPECDVPYNNKLW